MRSLSKELSTESPGFDGSLASGSEENFRAGLFGDVARVVWPLKTDATVAAIAGVSDRAARDILRGKVAVPACVLIAMMEQIAGRPRRRQRRS